MNTDNKAVALQFIEAMSTANADLATPCLADDAFTVSKGFGHFSGVRPREVMLNTIKAFEDLLPNGLQLKVERVTAEGDRVIVECEGNAMTTNGEPYCNEYCFIFTMRDGLITRIDEYFCNVLADEILWPMVAARNDDALAAKPR